MGWILGLVGLSEAVVPVGVYKSQMDCGTNQTSLLHVSSGTGIRTWGRPDEDFEGGFSDWAVVPTDVRPKCVVGMIGLVCNIH